MRARTRILVATGVAVAAIGSASVAWAWFSASASGAGSAATSGMQPVTVTALVGGDAPASLLQPGGTADVILRVRNPNAFAVRLVSVSGNGTVTSSGGSGACTTTGVSFTNQPSLSIPIAASSTTLVHLPGAASMSTSSSSGCQGATFAIPVAITVRTP